LNERSAGERLKAGGGSSLEREELLGSGLPDPLRLLLVKGENADVSLRVGLRTFLR
jgi:hypothetical protein